MKINYTLLTLLSVLLSTGIMGCSSDTDEVQKVEIPEMVLEEDSIEVTMGSTMQIGIVQGGGEYKAFSLDTSIAEVELVDSKLTVKGVKLGATSLIISDNDNCYQQMAIAVYIDKLVLEQEEVALNFKLGHGKTIAIDVLKGNGGYTAITDNENIQPSINGEQVILESNGQEGVAKITVTDSRGLEAVIQVEASATTIPYDEAEQEEIKNDATLRQSFNGQTMYNEGSYYTFLNEMVGDLNLYGWDYRGSYYLKIYFGGDKSIGEKPNSKLAYKYYSANFNDEPINFEVIKNDGTKIWATYSFVSNGKLNFGHFCQNVNP